MTEKRLIYKPVDCMAQQNNTESQTPAPLPPTQVSTPAVAVAAPQNERIFYVILSFVGLDFVLSLTKFILERYL